MKRRTVAVALSTLALGAAFAAPPASAAGGAHYLDCSAPAGGDGNLAHPWNSLDAASAHRFGPGERLLLKRGTTCEGTLTPTGSGTARAPITIDAYGSGAKPVIDAGTTKATPSAVEIRNESYWTLANLDIRGGYWRSLWIVGDQPDTTFHGFRLSNVEVHDNGFRAGGADGSWLSSVGGVVIEPCNATTKLSGVTLDHVYAHDTHSVGIQLGHSEKAAYGTNPASQNTPDCHLGIGLPPTVFPAKDGVSDILVDHSESGDNEASGIWATSTTNLTVQHSTLYRNGNGGAPASGKNGKGGLNGEGFWWSNSYNVLAQYNESYGNKWGGGDGGGFDADTRNEKSLIQYNYAHDNESYCVATFGGAGSLTTGTVIRHNTCVNNGTYGDAQYEGDIFTWTAGKGTSTPSTIADYQAYQNTIIRQNPGPAFYSDSLYDPNQPVSFTQNKVTHADGAKLVDVLQAGPVLDRNSYTITGANPQATFVYGDPKVIYPGVAEYRDASKQDLRSTFSPAGLEAR
ncbi:right-handed parallel beta-helix repeat-containing protein [Amycolatopsis sp. NPDC049253]|uniref:right-handed parallel beta-helix repeat-containing protein n=1 Tax=Amycolatopsis sp. NPDC049253 TaxID=3155274 RepID=UPI0034131397